jgi:hypothetical protein
MIEPFLEHYLGLGVAEIVLLDNGSRDQTLDRAARFERVTLLRCTLPFQPYESSLKRYLIERWGEGHWCLAVDGDEFFDYPGSDQLPFPGLLRYLHERGYTAVMATMLEMFPDGPIDGWPEGGRELIEASVWYDLTNLVPSRTWRLRLTNKFADTQMPFYRGGMRYQLMGLRTVATKFPLIYYTRDGKLSLRRIGHFCAGAHVGDFSAVLRHYKFDRSFVKRWQAMAQQGPHYASRAALASRIETPSRLILRGASARRLEHVNQLVDAGLLRASVSYWDYTRSWTTGS